MSPPSASRRVVSFGKFEVDLVARELRKNGAKIHLQDQPFQVLALLLENPGQAVAREELRKRLWSTDTFVDFDNGLNTAINKIREALGDSAESQRFIETLPRRGYRFIAPVAPDGSPASTRDLEPLTSVAPPARQWRLWIISGVAGLFVIATVLLAFLYFHQRPPTSHVVRFEIPVPEKVTGIGSFALSPDGRNLTFIGAAADGRPQLWVRSLDALESHALEGTDDVYGFPFWSPDSRFIVFAVPGKLKKIEVSGAAPITLCDGPHFWGGSWNRDDTIILGSESGIQRLAASGGSPSALTSGAPAVTPSFLPDGRHFVYLRAGSTESQGNPGLYLGSLDTKPKEQSPTRLMPADSSVIFTPSSDPALGYLLFVRGAKGAGTLGTLVAQPFDTRRFEPIGEALPIAEHVPNLGFSASATNTLAYLAQPTTVLATGIPGSIQGQLAWFGRDGKSLGSFGEPGIYRSLALSPDGKKVAFERSGTQSPGIYSLWLYDFERGVTTRFTFDSHLDSDPVWSPDGSQIAFGSNKGGTVDLYRKPSNLSGQEEPLFKSKQDKLPTSWSPDGGFLLYSKVDPQPYELWLLPVGSAGAESKPVLVERAESNQVDGRFSPDGRWVAYFSDESGRNEIYVRPFDISSAVSISAAKAAPATGKWMVSRDGGTSPLWRRDGKEMFYLSLDGMAMAVEVNTSGTMFQAGIPKAMFKMPPGVVFWDVSADGKKFLMAAPSGASATAQPPLTVVLNWQEMLKK